MSDEHILRCIAELDRLRAEHLKAFEESTDRREWARHWGSAEAFAVAARLLRDMGLIEAKKGGES